MSLNTESRIKVLDSVTANQIAAGEVVERPFSVVKELVENAIDSGATKIEIKIKDAGTTLISVNDNGCGMSPDDLVKCLLSHATSKIKKIDDLDSLNTLGFRGEALAAIASVSKLKIISKPHEQEFAYSIYCEGGKHQLPIEAAAKDGTTVIVEDLFFNTPARKKFLRSHTTELSYISDCLSHLALSHPDIAFLYQNEGKTVLKTSGNGKINDVVMSIYGQNILSELLPVEQLQPVLINGYISKPTYTKSSRSQYNFFINGRWIQSKEIARCIDDTYHTLIPQGRYPFVLLFFQVPPSSIDVNVHPAKLEIKFKEFYQIENALKDAIKSTLFGKKNAQSLTAKKTGEKLDFSDNKNSSAPYLSVHEASKVPHSDFTKYFNSSQQTAINFRKQNYIEDIEKDYVLKPQINNDNINGAENNTTQINTESKPVRDFCYSDLRILGQAAGTYIIAAGEDGLYITDQHAAHERLQYEKFKHELVNKGKGSANLLIPINLDLTHQETLLLSQYIIPLTDMGFVIEHFGGNSFVLRGVPLWYEGAAADTLLQDILAEFAAGGKPTVQDILEEKLFCAACKSAIKGNQYQDMAQINALFEALDANPYAITCPHGRPITVKIMYSELQRRFLRSGI